mmetsp:Transcript_66592/g.142426  ORF Transcript_66592/g.142426 Transcript_66592/m.142426 type:complete len:137 (-) Transcript_66592:609-1019(-)
MEAVPHEIPICLQHHSFRELTLLRDQPSRQLAWTPSSQRKVVVVARVTEIYIQLVAGVNVVDVVVDTVVVVNVVTVVVQPTPTWSQHHEFFSCDHRSPKKEYEQLKSMGSPLSGGAAGSASGADVGTTVVGTSSSR